MLRLLFGGGGFGGGLFQPEHPNRAQDVHRQSQGSGGYAQLGEADHLEVFHVEVPQANLYIQRCAGGLALVSRHARMACSAVDNLSPDLSPCEPPTPLVGGNEL